MLAHLSGDPTLLAVLRHQTLPPPAAGSDDVFLMLSSEWSVKIISMILVLYFPVCSHCLVLLQVRYEARVGYSQ